MKILFAIVAQKKRDPYNALFTSNLLQFLSARHELAIIADTNANSIYSKFDLSSIPRYRRNEVDFSEWNIIITLDVMALRTINRISTKHETPIIFISLEGHWQAQPFACKNLIQILTSSIPSTSMGLPKELYRNFRRPVFCHSLASNNRIRKPIENGGRLKAIHFVQESDYDFSILRTIIAAVNYANYVDLTIITEAVTIDIIKTVANGNVTIIAEKKFSEDLIDQFDLAITSEYYALKALYLGVPTILMGTRGFGGLVTTKNISEHLKWHFNGRIGGEVGEVIPRRIFREELSAIKRLFADIMTDTAEVSTIIREQFSPEKNFTLIENSIEESAMLFNKLSTDELDTLRPVKNGNINLITISPEDNTYLLVDENYKIRGQISRSESLVLGHCDGKKTVSEMSVSSGFQLSEVREFIKELWFEKIVHFHLSGSKKIV